MSSFLNFNQLLQDIPAAERQRQGEGAVVAVLDTGCVAHPDLLPNIVGFYDAVKQKLCKPAEYSDDTGHGTFVSGLIASGGGSSGITGVAPRAKIIVVKVSDDGMFYPAYLFNALQWLLQNCQPLPAVVNMSFDCSEGSSGVKIQQLLEQLAGLGIALVAAGNNNLRLFGNQKPMYPAREARIMAVGSLHGEVPSGLVLNKKISYLIVRREEYQSICTSGAGFQKRGSSFASAMVSGAFALLKASYPGMPLPDIKLKLNNLLSVYNSPDFNNPYKIYRNENADS